MQAGGGGAFAAGCYKLRGHHRAGHGTTHGTRTLYAIPNYCTGQPSAETPLHNRNGINGVRPVRREEAWGHRRTTSAGTPKRRHTTVYFFLLFFRKGLTPIPTRSCPAESPPSQNEPSFRLVSSSTLCARTLVVVDSCESVLGNNYLHTENLTALLLCGHLHTLASALRTILQHCFLRRSITQRKFQTKLRKHFFLLRQGWSRGRGFAPGVGWSPPAWSTEPKTTFAKPNLTLWKCPLVKNTSVRDQQPLTRTGRNLPAARTFTKFARSRLKFSLATIFTKKLDTITRGVGG